MIVVKLTDSERIEPLHPLFKRLFDYVKTHPLSDHPAGRIELDGDNLFINVVHTDAVAADKQPLEAHRDYIDVHILLEGNEKIGWTPVDSLPTARQPYAPDTDCALYAGAPQIWVNLRPGEAMIVYPEDPHAPLVGEGKIKKLIGKVKILS